MAKIIAGSSMPSLAQGLSNYLSLTYLESQIQKFADEELRIELPTSLYEEEVIIVQSTCKPANDHLMELLLLADAAHRVGARRIIALVPYFGYSRQDKPFYEGGPISARLVATLLETANINHLITLDLHSKQVEGFFKIGLQNIDPICLFANHFKPAPNLIVVSPDIGGVIRAQKLAQALDCDIAVLNKSRTTHNDCEIKQVIGQVQGKKCLIIDDIVDTAQTLCKAATVLKKEGALSIEAVVTHAVLSDEAISNLSQAPIDTILTTASVPQSDLPSHFKCLDIIPILGDALKKILK